MTTLKSSPFKHCKHFRKAVALAFGKLKLCRQLRLLVFNETHTNSYANSYTSLTIGQFSLLRLSTAFKQAIGYTAFIQSRLTINI